MHKQAKHNKLANVTYKQTNNTQEVLRKKWISIKARQFPLKINEIV